MARVVQRQANPPYLLIVFVALFVAATIGMAFFWIRSFQTGNLLAEKQANYEKVISNQEMNRQDPQLKDMIARAGKSAPGRPAMTVYAQQAQQIAELAKQVTGEDAAADQAFKAANDQLGPQAGSGLIPQIRELIVRLQQASQLAASRGQLLDETNEAMAQRDQALAQLQENVKAQLDDLNKQRLDLEAQVQQRHQELLGAQDQSSKELSQERSRLNATISNQISQIQQLEQRLQQTDQMVQRLRNQLDQRRGSMGQAAMAGARTADGKILEVIDRQGICYINIGSSGKVVPGLTFSVYPSTGIPDSGEGNAQILVTNVKDNISECRIVEQESGNPVITGDLIGNIAFNSQRTYNFVVGGEFDLRQTGTPSANDLEEVRMLVRRSGGHIGDAIGVNTDFVVLGEEPAMPAKPLESAPATVWAAYNAQLERYNSYQKIRQQAQEMHVPILNTNRFLAFMGYAQAKPAS